MKMRRLFAIFTSILVGAVLLLLGCSQSILQPTSTPISEPTAGEASTPTPSPTQPSSEGSARFTPSFVESPPAPLPPFQMSDATNKTWYLPGEEIVVEFSWKNVSRQPLKVKPFPLAIYIRNLENKLVWASRPGQGEYNLRQGEILKCNITWDQHDLGGNKVEPGYYFLDVDYQATQTLEKIGTIFSGYSTLKILVQFPQGAIDKTVTVEQAKALQDGSKIVLKDLALSPFGAKAHVLFYPTDYIGPAIDRERIFFGPAFTVARYQIDNGPLKSMSAQQLAVSNFQREVIGLDFDFIDPIPRGTKSLTFIIDKIKWKETSRQREFIGPFEFRVELE